MESKLPPIEYYSKPLKIEKRKLCTIYHIKPRSKAVKPGRELIVAYDERYPRVNGFKTRYAYFVRFLKKGNAAGNHYHEKKNELMIPVVGDLTIKLEDIETKKKETIIARADKPVAVWVKPRIAHAVVAGKPSDIILVLASTPSADDDEFPYQIR
ncbi:MAG: WxcM-like domain-containing protein [Candidatus Micrarchaeota archaeon]|nr:WxcM-like domain-containing protein [Candidatus Micrarchaeota archaeon]